MLMSTLRDRRSPGRPRERLVAALFPALRPELFEYGLAESGFLGSLDPRVVEDFLHHGGENIVDAG